MQLDIDKNICLESSSRSKALPRIVAQLRRSPPSAPQGLPRNRLGQRLECIRGRGLPRHVHPCGESRGINASSCELGSRCGLGPGVAFRVRFRFCAGPRPSRSAATPPDGLCCQRGRQRLHAAR
jgi:hypothetical protein